MGSSSRGRVLVLTRHDFPWHNRWHLGNDIFHATCEGVLGSTRNPSLTPPWAHVSPVSQELSLTGTPQPSVGRAVPPALGGCCTAGLWHREGPEAPEGGPVACAQSGCRFKFIQTANVENKSQATPPNTRASTPQGPYDFLASQVSSQGCPSVPKLIIPISEGRC